MRHGMRMVRMTRHLTVSCSRGLGGLGTKKFKPRLFDVTSEAKKIIIAMRIPYTHYDAPCSPSKLLSPPLVVLEFRDSWKGGLGNMGRGVLVVGRGHTCACVRPGQRRTKAPEDRGA